MASPKPRPSKPRQVRTEWVLELGSGKALTMNHRGNWQSKHRLTQYWKEQALNAALEARIGAQPRIAVQLVIDTPDRRRRDPGNYQATQKPCVDGLVDAGVVPDDTTQWVEETLPELRPTDTGRWRYWLHVRALDPKG